MKKPARKKITAALLCAALSWQGCVYAQQMEAETAKETDKTLEALYPAPEALVLLNSNGTLGIMPLGAGTGTDSIQEGTNANASRENSIAFGTNAKATSAETIAIGKGSNATEKYTTAIGWVAKATEEGATAVGNRSEAQKIYATALGAIAKATGLRATALGSNTEASGSGSVAIGEGAKASDQLSIAVGDNAKASSSSAVAIGSGANASSENSVAIGANTYVSAANTVSFASMNSSYGSNYHNLEGIEDVYVNGGIIFTDDGAGSNADLQQGELRGVTKINGISFGSSTSNNTTTYTIGNIVFDSSGNVTSINGTSFSDLVNANHDLSGITGDISKLQEKVNSINSDISGIGNDITGIKEDITNIKNDIVDLENSSGNVDGEDIKPGSVTTDKVTVGDADSGTQTVIDGSGTVMTKNEGGFSNTTTMDGSSTVMTKTDGSTTGTTTTEAGSIKVSSETTGTDGSKQTTSVSIAGGDIELSKTGADGKQQTIKVGEEISSIRGDMDSMRSDINAMGRSIDRLGEEIDEVGALSAALAGLHPNPINANSRADFAMAVGSYDGESAIAAGAFYRPDKRTMLSLGASATSGNQMFNMGVTFALDKLPEKENTNSEVLQAVLARLDKLEAENAELKAQVAAQKEADNA